jgi:phage baseplate assembly protein W
MSKKIMALTAEQKARFPEFVRKWTATGLSTQPADRERAESAIRGLYALTQLKEPRVIWLPCPISAALSAVCYAAIIQHRIVGAEVAAKNVEVYSAVYSAVDSAVGSAVYSAVDSAVRSAVGSAVGSAVDSAVDSAVGSAVGSAVDSAVRSAVGSAVDSAVRSAVDPAVGSAVDSAVRSAVYSAVDSAVDSAVGSAVRSAVDSAVRSAVYSAVDSAVYSAVDPAVGSAVRLAVYSAVYSAVDSAVDSAVRSAVRSAGYAFFGGSLWNAGYSAWADYFNEVCAVAIDRNFLEMTASAGFYWTLDGICFASERPSEIHLDQGGQLHAEDGMAIRYAGTGWGLYSWHGYRIPDDHSWIITDKARITAEAIMAEPNAELRRIMCEVTAFAPIRAIAEVVAEDVDGNGHARRLMTANIKGDVIRIVEVQNGSLEPDGSRRKFLLGALAGQTPRDVIAASYGINSKFYIEACRT